MICQFCIIAWLMRFDRMVGVPTCAATRPQWELHVNITDWHLKGWVRQLWVHCGFSCHTRLDVHASIGWWQSATFSSQSIKVMANSVKVSNIPQQTSDIVIFKIRRVDIHYSLKRLHSFVSHIASCCPCWMPATKPSISAQSLVKANPQFKGVDQISRWLGLSLSFISNAVVLYTLFNQSRFPARYCELHLLFLFHTSIATPSQESSTGILAWFRFQIHNQKAIGCLYCKLVPIHAHLSLQRISMANWLIKHANVQRCSIWHTLSTQRRPCTSGCLVWWWTPLGFVIEIYKSNSIIPFSWLGLGLGHLMISATSSSCNLLSHHHRTHTV